MTGNNQTVNAIINGDTIQLLALIVTIITITIGILQYRKAQKWRRQEFLSKQIHDFFDDYYVDRALIMLDWNVYDITNNEGMFLFKYKSSMLKDALEDHEKRFERLKTDDDLFSYEEKLIREIFDKFLLKLGIFKNNIDNNLYSFKEIRPYLVYYLDIINGINTHSMLEKEEIESLMNYVNSYGFEPEKKLLEQSEFFHKQHIIRPKGLFIKFFKNRLHKQP